MAIIQWNPCGSTYGYNGGGAVVNAGLAVEQATQLPMFNERAVDDIHSNHISRSEKPVARRTRSAPDIGFCSTILTPAGCRGGGRSWAVVELEDLFAGAIFTIFRRTCGSLPVTSTPNTK